MALGKGIPVINGFDLNSKLPLDSRAVADTMEEMNKLVTDGSVGDGQLCYCKADKKLYKLSDNVWSEVGGGASVSPTLNLIDWENGEIRTSITEEEKTNLEKDLYNQVMYASSLSSLSGVVGAYLPSKIMTINGEKSFSYFIANESGSVIGLAFYPFTIGEKDPTTGNYPIVINKDDGGTFGIDSYIPTVEGEVKEITQGSITTKKIVMKSKPSASLDKFILRYVDGDITNTILFNRVSHMTSPMKVSGFVGNDYDNYYSCDSTSTDIDEMDIPMIDQTTLFNKWNIAVKHIDDVIPQPILPCTASDNGKVLSVVNGEAQWASSTGGVSVTFED